MRALFSLALDGPMNVSAQWWRDLVRKDRTAFEAEAETLLRAWASLRQALGGSSGPVANGSGRRIRLGAGTSASSASFRKVVPNEKNKMSRHAMGGRMSLTYYLVNEFVRAALLIGFFEAFRRGAGVRYLFLGLSVMTALIYCTFQVMAGLHLGPPSKDTIPTVSGMMNISETFFGLGAIICYWSAMKGPSPSKSLSEWLETIDRNDVVQVCGVVVVVSRSNC